MVVRQPTTSAPSAPIEEKEEAPKKYKFVEKVFSLTELDYWKRYGITPDILMKYDVVSLDTYESVGEKGSYCYTSTPGSPIFGYRGDTFIKIYRPKEKLRFQFGGKKPRPYCFGLNQLPFRGDMVFITGGEKDVLSLHRMVSVPSASTARLLKSARTSWICFQCASSISSSSMIWTRQAKKPWPRRNRS